jgi:hypothetical protein
MPYLEFLPPGVQPNMGVRYSRDKSSERLTDKGAKDEADTERGSQTGGIWGSSERDASTVANLAACPSGGQL